MTPQVRAAADVAPSNEDPAVAALSEGLGGPWGAHARARRWWTPVRVLLTLSGVAWVLGMLLKTPCAADAWQRPGADFGRGCWNDWGWAGLGQPGGATTADLPPVPGLVAALGRLSSRGVDASADRVLVAAALTAVLVAIGMALATVLLTRTTAGRPWDAAVLALAPMAVLTWVTSWHVLAAIALAVALWAWARGRAITAGVATGLAAAIVLSSAALLIAMVVVARRGGRVQRRVTLDACAAATFTWLAFAVPPFIISGAVRDTWWLRPIDSGSLWLVASQASDTEIATRTVVLVGGAVWLAWTAVVVRIALRSKAAPSVAQVARVALPLVAGALLVSSELPPGAGLVLLPLAAVAVPRWGVIAVWQACEVVHLVVTGFYYAGWMAPADGGDVKVLWFVIVLRAAGLVWLAAHAVWRIRSGDLDPVEVGGGVADPDIDLLADRGHPGA